MTDDRRDRMPEPPLRQAAEPPRGPSANILDALDMGGVEDVDIAFERLVSYPHPASFD